MSQQHTVVLVIGGLIVTALLFVVAVTPPDQLLTAAARKQKTPVYKFELTCAAIFDTVAVNAPAFLQAVGGNGNYTWDASDGNGILSTRTSILDEHVEVRYPQVGDFVVRLTSGNKSTECLVHVVAEPSPEPSVEPSASPFISPTPTPSEPPSPQPSPSPTPSPEASIQPTPTAEVRVITE